MTDRRCKQAGYFKKELVGLSEQTENKSMFSLAPFCWFDVTLFRSEAYVDPFLILCQHSFKTLSFHFFSYIHPSSHLFPTLIIDMLLIVRVLTLLLVSYPPLGSTIRNSTSQKSFSTTVHDCNTDSYGLHPNRLPGIPDPVLGPTNSAHRFLSLYVCQKVHL